ncbi:type I-G CRISPR-associated protein Csb2, partial [Ancrocorticia sp.]
MEETIQEFGLRATFLLDTYLGHRSDGSREPFPDAARLHAALTNAACCGSTAQVSEDGSSLIPHPQAVESLRWLDEHEPVEMELPQSSPLGTGEEFAYRNVSSVNAKHSAEKRLISDGAGLSGPVGYIWKDVPRNVAQWLDLLAADVGCLGEATSPVIIRTGATATHRRAREQTIFARGGERFRVPRAGRTDELMKRHGEANPKKKPTVAADKLKQGELPKPSRISQECVRSSRYVPIVAGRAPADDLSVPWSSVYVVPLSGDNVQPEDRMAWAAALHKALIAAVGENVSSLLTGKYPEGSPRPANGLAVHCVPSERVAHLGIEQPALLIMSPAC